jgi:hypothetical protein
MPVRPLTTAPYTYIFTILQRTNNECRRTVELVQSSRCVARTDDVKDVIRNLQNSPTTAFLRSLSLHERILLAAPPKCVRRTGVFEIPWADVSYQHHLYSGVFADSAPLLRELEVYLTLCSLHQQIVGIPTSHRE